MATVRCLMQAHAPRDPGWTELLAHPPIASPFLAHTVLAVPADSDSIQLRSGDVDVSALVSSARGRHRQREGQAGDRTGPLKTEAVPTAEPSVSSMSLPEEGPDRDGLGGMTTRERVRRSDNETLQPAAANIQRGGVAPTCGRGGPDGGGDRTWNQSAARSAHQRRIGGTDD